MTVESEKQSSQPRAEERERHGSRSSVPVDTVTVLCGLPSRLPSCLLVIMEVQIYQGWERGPVQVGKQRPKGVQLRVELGIESGLLSPHLLLSPSDGPAEESKPKPR